MPEIHQTISHGRKVGRIRQGGQNAIFLSDGYQTVLGIVCLMFMVLLAGLVGPLNNPAQSAQAPEAFPDTPTAKFIVTKLADSEDGACDSDCSLREAISVAAPNDTVIFASGLTGTIILRSTLKISKNVTIDGPSTRRISISGNNAVRVFYVDSGVNFTVRNLTVTNGLDKGSVGSNGGKCDPGSVGGAAWGGGLYSAGGSVTIINSTFSNNRAEGGAGGDVAAYLFGDFGSKSRPAAGYMGANEFKCRSGGAGGNGGGGALFTAGPLRLINSTFTGNKAEGGAGGKGGSDSGMGGFGGSGMGGALYSTGTVIMVNCTFSHNRAMGGHGGIRGVPWRHGFNGMSHVPSAISFVKPGPSGFGAGGAIYYGPSDVRMSNCTLAKNSATGGTADNNRANNIGFGGAICGVGKLTIKNSLLAGDSEGGNCAPLHSINSEGYNIDSDGTCGFTATGDLSDIDPRLDSLKDNGGPTLTHGLNSDSPAIDGGNPTGCSDHNGNAITIDQRGRSRPWGAGCDIGAYEFSR